MVEREEAATGVVEDAIEHDAHPASVCRVEQLAQRVIATEQRIDLEVVVRVVAVVRAGAEDRGQVDRGDPEILEVPEVLGDPAQVAALEPVDGRWRIPRLQGARLVDPLAAGEPVREDLVEDRVADPVRRVDRHRRRQDLAARAADDEPRFEPTMIGHRAARLPDDGEQQPDRLFALLADRLVDRGQWRFDVRGQVDVVEADDADVARDVEPEITQRMHRPDRHDVAHGQDRGGAQAGRPDRCQRGTSAGDAGRTEEDAVIADLDADGPKGLPVPEKTAVSHALGTGHGGGERRLDTDDDDVAVAERDEVLGCGSGATGVVDLDRGLVGEGSRVDHDYRDARAPDRLDLRVLVAQADRDDAVDRCPAQRPGERPAQRRDEMERVPRLFGRDRDSLGERAEERVGEDDRERLRRQDADGQRLALGQHPGDRVRRVAELLGDTSDPAGGLGRQAFGAVEGERHRRLRDSRLAGDVGDAGADRALLHAGLRSTASPGMRPVLCRSPGENRFSDRLRDLASAPDRLSTVQYDARPMLDRIRAMPGGIRLFLAYALLILAGIGVSLRSVVDTAISTPVSLEGVVVMVLLAYTIFTTTLVLQRKQAARGLALGLASLTIPLVPLLALSRLLVEALFVATLGLLLFRGLLRPEVRTYLNEQ